MHVARIIDLLRDSLGQTDQAHEPVTGCEAVDVFMTTIVYNVEKARENAPEMIELLKEWPGESQGYPVPPLGEEISYIAAGAVLGDQYYAFMLFAYGKLLGWWEILDPTILGLEKDDEMARLVASMGLISIMGYQPTVPA